MPKEAAAVFRLAVEVQTSRTRSMCCIARRCFEQRLDVWAVAQSHEVASHGKRSAPVSELSASYFSIDRMVAEFAGH